MNAWFTDKLSANEIHRHRLKKAPMRARTKFQSVILADSIAFGRCLILDDEIQSAQKDEFIYHECLVHPAMACHPDPRDVLVLGGGEGATVREILRYPSVRRVTMVDIDGELVEFCRKYLFDWHRGALAHPKARLVIADARKYILETRGQFDIIVSDLPTPSQDGPLKQLYTKGFFRHMIARLKPDGIFVTQAGSGSPHQLEFHARLYRTLKTLFKVVRPFYAFVPSFGVPWAFLMASAGSDPRQVSAARIDRRLRKVGGTLRFYDGETHEGLFRIPKSHQEQLK